MPALPGWWARRRADVAPASELLRAIPSGAADNQEAARPQPQGSAAGHDRLAADAPRVHQVLATLGYGDAIGHEVLGIQRVLRGAGYQSQIYVETADPRLEDLTLDYRDLVGQARPDDVLIHHFSIGSRASRTAYALPGRMVLVYHNITPPEYFIGVHKDLVKLCFRGRRELTAYIDRCDLALGRLRVQPPGARGARLSVDRRAAGRARLLAISMPLTEARSANWPIALTTRSRT